MEVQAKLGSWTNKEICDKGVAVIINIGGGLWKYFGGILIKFDGLEQNFEDKLIFCHKKTLLLGSSFKNGLDI